MEYPLNAIEVFMRYIGADLDADGMEDTPKRMLKAYKEMCRGYEQDPGEILARQFDIPCDEMVVVSGIPFWSLCEHHLLPFNGIATVAYIPNGAIVGLSKIPRLVECYANRVQVQERLTQQVTEALMSNLSAKGAGCVIRAKHTCMQMRGVKSQGTMMTSCLRGLLFDDSRARSEFLELAK